MSNQTALILEDRETLEESVSSLRQEDWYKHWSEEMRAQIVETGFFIRNEAIKLNYSIASEVISKIPDFTRSEVYGKRLVEIVAEDIKCSAPRIYKCLQFYYYLKDTKKQSVEEYLGEKGKDWSWNKTEKEFRGLTEIEEPKKKTEKPKIEIGGEIPEGVTPPNLKLTYSKETQLYILEIDPNDYPKIDFSKVKEDLLQYLPAH